MNRPRILIVEDERITAEDIKHTLEKYGYRITSIVSTAAAAIIKTAEEQPDLVLMDIVLKGKGDGIEAASHIYQKLHIPVVYLTAYSDEETLKRAKISQPFGYVLKPFEERELYSNIEIALYKNRMEKKLSHLNLVLMALREINLILDREKNRYEMISQICKSLPVAQAYIGIWFILLDEAGCAVAGDSTGIEPGVSALIEQFNENRLPVCIRRLMQEANLQIYINPTEKCPACSIRKNGHSQGVFVTRIRFRERLYGYFGISLPIELAEESEEQALFLEVADDVSLAFHQLDILSEKQATESKLTATEKLFRAVIESAQDLIFIKDRNLRFQLVNPAMERFLGKAADKIIGRTEAEIFAPDPVVRSLEQDRLALNGNIVETEEMWDHNGQACFFHVLKMPIRDAQGDVINICGYARDISERKKTEQLRESLASITRATVTATDLPSLFAEIHRIVVDLLGVRNFYIALHDREKREISFPFFIDENDSPPQLRPEGNGLSEYIIRTGKGKCLNQVQIEELAAQGKIEWIGTPCVSWLGVPLILEGKILGMMAVQSYDTARMFQEKEKEFMEILSGQVAAAIQRKRADEDIRKWNIELESRVRERTVELEQINRELESFSYSISHDLRAPLRVINGYTQMIREDHADTLDEKALQLLQIIQQNTRQMSNLIDDLLNFSRLGRLDVHKQEVDMGQIVKIILDERIQAIRERTVRIETGDLPIAWGDPNLLRQVWINLIDNALKFSRRSDPRIVIGSHPENGQPVYFIRDNGVGFDQKYADKLFQVFYRLHNPQDFEGTGVGLAIVQRVIARHQGRVWCEGNLEEGATFFFSLPPNEV